MRYTRSHAAREVRRELAWGCFLHRTTKFSTADLLALIAAGALVAMYLFRAPASRSGRHLLVALIIAAGFALLAWIAHGVNWSGALTGLGIAFIFTARDVRLFWELLLVFVLTLAATRFGRSRKQQLQMAEAAAGRSASQVMANLGIAAMVLVIAPAIGPLLALAALAEAAADTCSSEIGTALPGKTVLLTSWKAVPPGVDGGVSVAGTLAALLAAAAVAVAASLLHLVAPRVAFALAGAGVLGSLFDSVLGAIFEGRGLLNNDLVNLLSTAAAALTMAFVTF